MNKKRWRILSLLLLIMTSIGVIYIFFELSYAMDGPPQRIRAYKQILNSLPNPPGWQSDAYFELSTGAVYGSRYYTVTGQYTDVITFFKTELPQQGYELFRERENIPPETQPGELRDQWTSFTFYSSEHYCLDIHVNIDVDRQLVQVGVVTVRITLYEAESKFFCSS